LALGHHAGVKEMRALNFPHSGKLGTMRLGFIMLAVCATTTPALLAAVLPASALSEIKREELPSPVSPPADDDGSPNAVPMPDPIETPKPSTEQPASPEDNEAPAQVDPESPPEDGSIARPHINPDEPLPEVVYDLTRLPEPVRRMRDLIVEACRSGDIQKLKPLIGMGDDATQLSLTDVEGEPIEFLKSLSGDTEGQEILAIMEEVLNAGYVHLDAGTPQELYVWPYFFALPLDKLDARQRVELFKIVTAGDYEDMKQFGTYIFYRVGITPEGKWAFFVAGD
jgi:hypothetical protein